MKAWYSKTLSKEDENAANDLYDWASSIALPSASVFGVDEDRSGMCTWKRPFRDFPVY